MPIAETKFCLLLVGMISMQSSLPRIAFAQPKLFKGASAAMPVVAILGVYHFTNPGLDVVKTQIDDHLSDKRQKEIHELVDCLKKFQPTKVAIEVPFGNKKIIEDYHHFFAGSYTLRANETDQVAFRLAKALNHPTVYPIDWHGRFDFGAVMRFLQENNDFQKLGWIQSSLQHIAQYQDSLIQSSTVMKILLETNKPESIEAGHQAYMELAKIGKDSVYVGADLVADWYERNLKIFQNITRMIDSDKDRILVIIGAGHVRWLQHYVEETPSLKWEGVLQYLKE